MPYLSIEGLCRGQQHYMQWNNDLILIMIRGPLLRAFRITVSFPLQNQSLRKELLWPLLQRWGNWGLVRLLISPESHGWRKVWTGEGTGKYTNKHSELAHGFAGLEMIIYTKSSSRVPDKWLALNNSHLVLLGSRLSINIIWFNFNNNPVRQVLFCPFCKRGTQRPERFSTSIQATQLETERLAWDPGPTVPFPLWSA